MGKLTTTKIEGLTAPGMYGDGRGLFLRIQKSATETTAAWVQRIVIEGKQVNRGLGSYPAITLKEAREQAAVNRALGKKGKNPFQEKASKPEAAKTFAYFAEDYFAKHRDDYKGRNKTHWLEMIENHAYPILGNKPIDAITRQDLLRLLQPLWEKKPETARKVYVKIKLILGYAAAFGYVEQNVANVIKPALPKQKANQHHPFLPHGEVGDALKMIDQATGRNAGKWCLQFLILTATRSNEARQAEWKEIDFDNRVWIIPASRMKTNQEHRVPLSDAALDVLRKAKSLNYDRLCFPSVARQPLSDMAFRYLLRRTGLDKQCVPHGFRTSFRMWASEHTNADFATMELCLAHTVGSAVERAYSRSDLLQKRRTLMQHWGEYLTRTEQAKVVSLR